MIDLAPVNQAFQEMLAHGTDRPCGLGALPTVGGKPAPLPYTVLYPLGALVSGAPLADRGEDADLRYQVTCVGARTDQAEWMADKVRRAVLQRAPTGRWQHELAPAGVDVWARELETDDGTDDAGAADGVVTSTQRFRLSATSVPQVSPSHP
ncbi:hypothetical protein ACFYVL_14090 [Streptomyces sp. NPDC004111]|uniref:hypothetical protein n=1 Tax=Streptomyces sp. NPDC004111 TaxID=3364690 RepID=UPI0036C289E1